MNQDLFDHLNKVSAANLNAASVSSTIKLVAISKTWQEWDKEKLGGITILDPDGFRDYPDDKLYTREEFLKTRKYSTVIMQK